MVGLSLVPSACSRARTPIQIVSSELPGPGLGLRVVVQWPGREVQDYHWRVVDQDEVQVAARCRPRGGNELLVEVHHGFVEPLVGLRLQARRDGVTLAWVNLGGLHPYRASLRARQSSTLSAHVDGSELVITGYEAFALTSVRLVRTDRAMFSESPFSAAAWSGSGPWVWRKQVAYAEDIEAVEVEVVEDGPVRHGFTLSGLTLDAVGLRPVIRASASQSFLTYHGIQLLLPEQNTLSDRDGVAEIVLRAESRLRLVELPKVIEPPADRFGLRAWVVRLEPEPIRVATPRGSTGSGVPSATTTVGPRSGPLPPLQVSFQTPPLADPRPPRHFTLSVSQRPPY